MLGNLFLCLLSCAVHFANSHSHDEEDMDTLTIQGRFDAKRININFNVTNGQDYSIAPPMPGVTMLSEDYYLCLWSYALQDTNEDGTKSLSNEIYSNLFSMSSGKMQVQQEYLLNRIRGYSQDSPSATALFNETNHKTQTVAVVWESQVEDPSNADRTIDAVFGRIIKWSITREGSTRYVRVTSPSSREWQISSPTIDYLHHINPNVVPIYNTGKFLVSWISYSEEYAINMVFIRIYYNSGRAYSDQIQVHDKDSYRKHYPRSIPLLHNMTMVSWLSYAQTFDTQWFVYGMVFDEEGNSVLNSNDDENTDILSRYSFLSNGQEDTGLTSNSVPVMTSLHNDPFRNNNYFMLAWNAYFEDEDGNEMNSLKAAVFMYSENSNSIVQISSITDLLDEALESSTQMIENPVMQNVANELYELEQGLNAKIALCYTLKDIAQSQSDVYCKMLEIALWQQDADNDAEVEAEIYVVSGVVMINQDTGANHFHQDPAITSGTILNIQRSSNNQNANSNEDSDDNDEDAPEFVVAWSNSRENGFDVYSRVLQVIDDDDSNAAQQSSTAVIGKQLDVIIFGVVCGIICVVVLICLGNRCYVKHKDKFVKRSSTRRMEQLGDESDDEDGPIGGTTYGNNTTMGNDTHPQEDSSGEDGDGVKLYTKA